jgi:hypothetical protein
MSIGAGGGAQTAGVTIVGNVALIVMSPDTTTVARPAVSGLAGPGDTEADADGVGMGDWAGGGETLTPCPVPVVLHAAVSAASTEAFTHVARIPPSLPHALRRTADVDRGRS